MSFLFTFSSPAPKNPFTDVYNPEPSSRPIPIPSQGSPIRSRKPSRSLRRTPPPSTFESRPINRKRSRGWLPEPMTSRIESHDTAAAVWGQPPELIVDEPRPAVKRRRLTDTIVSTLTSVALVGAAVGITAYRLWRDMGKPIEEVATAPPHIELPPPYTEQAFMNHDMQPEQPRQPQQPQYKQQVQQMQHIQQENTLARAASTANTPGLKPRKSGGARRKAPAVNRARRKTLQFAPSQPHLSPVASTFSQPAPSSSFSSHVPMPNEVEDDDDDKSGIDDQMDWMGAQLRSLIEEGKRALGKEIVLSTEGVDDEEASAIDDGHEGWEEDEPSPSSSFSRPKHIHRSNSRKRPAALTLPNPYPASSTSATLSSPKRFGHSRGSSRSGISPALTSPRLGPPPHTQEEQVTVLFEPSSFSRQIPFRRDSDDTASKELRESMERVRRAYGIQR